MLEELKLVALCRADPASQRYVADGQSLLPFNVEIASPPRSRDFNQYPNSLPQAQRSRSGLLGRDLLPALYVTSVGEHYSFGDPRYHLDCHVAGDTRQ